MAKMHDRFQPFYRLQVKYQSGESAEQHSTTFECSQGYKAGLRTYTVCKIESLGISQTEIYVENSTLLAAILNSRWLPQLKSPFNYNYSS
jgi:hypothetical protein